MMMTTKRTGQNEERLQIEKCKINRKIDEQFEDNSFRKKLDR